MNDRFVRRCAAFSLLVTLLAFACSNSEVPNDSTGGAAGSAAWSYDCELTAPPGGAPPPGCGGGFCGSCVVDDSGLAAIENLFYVVDDATRIQPTIRSAPGEACMAGTVSDMATFVLGFEQLDAVDLGITDIRFTVDSPPAGGLQPTAASIGPDETPTAFFTNSRIAVTTSDPFTLSLSPDTLEAGFDPTRLVALQFFLPFHEPLEYDFCVTSVEFLDSEGNPVVP